MACIQTRADSLESLVRAVLEITREIPSDMPVWLRGHQSDKHQLLPSLLRDKKTSDEVFEREKRLLIRFR